MSTEIATRAPSRVEVFVGEVLPPDRMDYVLSSLPAHVKPERFQRNLVVAVTQHPKLLECDPAAVFNEVSKAAALGLYLDPQLGEAYLITGWDSRANRSAPQLRLGYRGLIKLARQSGQIQTVYAHEVCQYDKLEISLGSEKKIVHKPDYFHDRGPVGLYYAVVHFADGTTDFEPMALSDIYRIRDRSDGWRAFKAGKIKSTPWASDESEMAKKTCLRRLLKRIPQSPELADALRIEDEDYRDGPDVPQRPSLSQRLRPNALPSPDGFNQHHIARELGSDHDDAAMDIQHDQGGADDVAVHPRENTKNPDDTSRATASSEPGGAVATSEPEKRDEVSDSPQPSPGSGEVSPSATSPSPSPSGGAGTYPIGDYHRTLARANQEKTLQGFDKAFREQNAWCQEPEAVEFLRAVYTVHVRRVKGKLRGGEYAAEIKRLGADK